ncbi:MAG: SPOR domain-containing protein [Acidobacteriota bacterium]
MEEKQETREFREIIIRGGHVWMVIVLLIVLCILFFFLGRWYESRISSYRSGSLMQKEDRKRDAARAVGEAEDLGETLAFFDRLPKEDFSEVKSKIERADSENENLPKKQQTYYSVQVSASKERPSSLKTKEKLMREGFASYIVEEKGKSGTYYKVRVGKFSTREEALETEKKLRKEGYRTWVMKIG